MRVKELPTLYNGIPAFFKEKIDKEVAAANDELTAAMKKRTTIAIAVAIAVYAALAVIFWAIISFAIKKPALFWIALILPLAGAIPAFIYFNRNGNGTEIREITKKMTGIAERRRRYEDIKHHYLVLKDARFAEPEEMRDLKDVLEEASTAGSTGINPKRITDFEMNDKFVAVRYVKRNATRTETFKYISSPKVDNPNEYYLMFLPDKILGYCPPEYFD